MRITFNERVFYILLLSKSLIWAKLEQGSRRGPSTMALRHRYQWHCYDFLSVRFVPQATFPLVAYDNLTHMPHSLTTMLTWLVHLLWALRSMECTHSNLLLLLLISFWPTFLTVTSTAYHSVSLVIQRPGELVRLARPKINVVPSTEEVKIISIWFLKSILKVGTLAHSVVLTEQFQSAHNPAQLPNVCTML